MTDFADDSNISLNAFDEQNADRNALNGKNGNEYNDNDMTNDSKTDEESDARDDKSIPIKANDDEDRKLFIGGLSWDTDENDLREYFKKFGSVTDVSIKYDAVSGNPRGFGFITFSSEDSIEEILKTGPHIIKGKTTDPKRAKSRPICKKIFVGGIDSNMSEEEIKKYFSKYGVVEGIELPFDRQRNRRREFCFIIFDTEESAEAAVKEPKQTIGSKECDIKKAQPQPVAQQQKRMQQQTAYDGYDASSSGSRRGGRRGGSQDQYQNPGNWSGYNGAVAQYNYGNYYGNQYPNAYGYPNQNYDYYSQYGYNYGDYWNYYGYGDQSGVTGDYSQSQIADTTGTAYAGTTAPAQTSSHTHSHHSSGSASGGTSAGKMSRKSGSSSSNYHPYRSSTQH